LHQLFNIIDTHDTARIKTILPLHYNAVIGLVFAMPGTPSVYYGTEAGMIGEHDPDCRRPMTWHAVDQSQYTFLQRLIQFRSNPVAQQVDIQFWSEGNTIYFKKPNNESLVGFISTDNVVAVPLSFQGKQAYDVLQDKPILLDQTINLSNFIGLYLLKEKQ
jgi:neopullulanase